MDVPEGAQFKDVTHLFEEASKEMDIDELLMVEGFSLYEAMSAVEIGDPRMDSGAALPNGEQHPDFDPLKPLLPEEVCWIIDRSMACEMHWHAGNALAQTVFTCLYMHNLSAIDYDHIRPESMANFDEEHPVQLVSLVIRAMIMGTVKCCDLAYRELIKGNVHDCEDWQGEKSDTSLLESVSPLDIVALLEDAELWLMDIEVRDLPFREELLYRIHLRKTLLKLLNLDLPRQTPLIVPLLAEARRSLSAVSQRPIEAVSEGSPAYSAFDPRITRRLHSIMPMRPLELPPQSETWKSIGGLLDGFELLYQLSSCEGLLAWNAVGLLRASCVRWTSSRLPIIRSLAQTIFSNGSTIMDKFAASWLVEHFFLELAHVSFGHIVSLFEQSSFGRAANSYEEFHSTLTRLIVQHIWASYHNRPRQRRHSMKTNLDWHILYDSALAMTARTKPRDSSDSRTLKCIPLAILHWRAGLIRDIVLSGFELELYSTDEQPLAYWFLAEVLSGHESILHELLSAVPEDTPAHNHLLVQLQYIALLKEMSLGLFFVLCRPSKFDAPRRWTNFLVRYKWTLHKKFTEIATPDPFLPDYRAYLREEKVLLAQNENERRQKATGLFDSAFLRLLQLGTLVDKDLALQLCRAEFTQYHLAGLMLVCENLKAYLTSSANANNSSEMPKLVWDMEVCAWFPKVKDTVSPEATS